MPAETVSTVDGVPLCWQAFGDRAHPALLLIAGAAQSMVWWEDELCQRLADGGRHVIRYDHRDTGRSASSPVGRPTYGSLDLSTDPLRVLDAADVARAHVVGLSMGGMIAQHLGLDHADRVQTLTLVASTPEGPGDDGNGLPPIDAALAATFAHPDPEPDWDDEAAVIEHRTSADRPYVGTLGFDEARMRRLATIEVRRTTDMASSMANHFTLHDGRSTRDRLATVAAPTLVLHGADDPLFPLGHGEALAREIPGARLVALPGMGHEVPPPPLWDAVVAAITAHTGG